MSTHVTKLCNSAFYHLQNIRCIRKYLSRDSLLALIHAFITSRLDFCNGLLYGLPKTQIVKLQRVQNAAAGLAMNIGKYSHVTQALQDLHWLPVRARIDFKILILVFKAIHGLAPPYVSDLITVKPKSSYNLRSNSSLLLSRLRRKCFLRLVPGLFMLLCRACGIVFRLSCEIFNHYVVLNKNLRPTFFGQARTFFFIIYLLIYFIN